MASFIYTAWFRDPGADEGDQDYEWPACIRVIAETLEAARSWGDLLAKERSQRLPSTVFLHSTTEQEAVGAAGSPDDLPTVADGEDAADATIGW
jgi:hypothetical protein